MLTPEIMSSVYAIVLMCIVSMHTNIAINHWELTSDGSIQPQVNCNSFRLRLFQLNNFLWNSIEGGFDLLHAPSGRFGCLFASI